MATTASASKVFMAPMAGITDQAFRTIVYECGGKNLISEMVAVNAIQYKNPKSYAIADVGNEPYPVTVQLVGNDPALFGDAAKLVADLGAAAIDINMGCPAPKVVKNGDGSKLLLDLDLAEEIVREVAKAVSIPVTVKMRKGWDSEHIVAVEAAKRFEKAGAAAITVHGRTRTEYYSGQCDLDSIRQVKEAVRIPVIGSGDVRDVRSAKKMFDETGVDGVMIGRATLGNPWVFKEIIDGLTQYDAVGTDAACPATYTPTNEERLQTILQHLAFAIQEKGEYVGIREMRKHISGYTKKLPNSSEFRSKVNTIEDKDELIHFITEYIHHL